jgi:uncharacterized protein (TIGR00369 family)
MIGSPDVSPDMSGDGAGVRTRTFQWVESAQTVGATTGRAGIDVLRDIAGGVLPAPPIATLMGFELMVVEQGYVELTLEPAEFHYSIGGSVDGGVYATMLDSAAGFAVQTLLPVGMEYTSLDLNIKFLRRLTVDTGAVRAVGTVTHFGTQTALVEARLMNTAERLLATATSSCLVFRQAGS